MIQSPNRVLLLEGIHQGAVDRLKSLGYEVDLEKSAFQGQDLIDRAQGYQALGIRSKTKVTSDILAKLPDLNVIGTFCIGTDQVDLQKANVSGVPVFNAPYSNTRSVAELIISEVIALSRSWAYRSQQLHQGQWEKTAKGSNEIRGKTIGIVGYGHIGSQVSVLAEAVGLNVIFYDVLKKLPLGNASVCPSLDLLLEQSDFVTLHVPDNPDTKDLMNLDKIHKMKKGSYLLNASRGSVVVLEDLKAAIESEHLAGAAVDVFPSEPDSNSKDFTNLLRGLPNVILTPHIGGSTEEAQANIGLEVSESIHRFLSLGATFGSVNFPHVDAHSLKECPRIINVHKNVPGVLSQVNSIISEFSGNVLSQRLATDNEIGYLILDVDFKGDFDAAIKRISGLPLSIRTRFQSK